MIDKYILTPEEREDDPYVSEIREVRSRLNEESGFDPETLAANVAAFARKIGMKVCPLNPVAPHFTPSALA